MTEEDLSWRPRRLLLALLEDADTTLVCAQTVTIARAFETEVSGVLVEETALFELAALTVCAEVGAVTRQFQPIEASSLAAQSERRAARFRRKLQALEASLERPVPLQVRRGESRDPLREARPEDLIFYTGAPSRLEDQQEVAALLEAARHSAGLLLQPPRAPRRDGPLVALYHSPEVADHLRPVLDRLAEGAEIEEHLAADTAEALVAGSLLAEQRGARLLAVELGEEQADARVQRALRQGLRRLNCPLLLINPQPQ